MIQAYPELLPQCKSALSVWRKPITLFTHDPCWTALMILHFLAYSLSLSLSNSATIGLRFSNFHMSALSFVNTTLLLISSLSNIFSFLDLQLVQIDYITQPTSGHYLYVQFLELCAEFASKPIWHQCEEILGLLPHSPSPGPSKSLVGHVLDIHIHHKRDFRIHFCIGMLLVKSRT